MKTNKRKIGDIGEAIVKRFLISKGFEIVEQNYLKKWGEIDIVAQKNNILHFIEVKTIQYQVSRENSGYRPKTDVQNEPVRPDDQLGQFRPEENVHPKKLERMYRTIETYLEEKKVSREKEWQVDVVTVRLDVVAKKAKVELIENVV